MKKDLSLKNKTAYLRGLFLIPLLSFLLIFVKTNLLHRAYAEPSASKSNNSPTNDISETKTPPPTRVIPKDAIADASHSIKVPMLEIHVANTGATLLRGAKVIQIEGDIIHVTTTWNEINLNWSIKTKFFTSFLTKAGKKTTLEEIKIGDSLTITGKLISGGTKPIIEAEFVRK